MADFLSGLLGGSGGMIGSSLLGGLLGSQGKQETSTNQKTTDPRIDPYIYGANGVLPAAQNWYNQNKSGMNDQMVTGMNNQWNQLAASKPGWDNMQSMGMQLMQGGIAGNPFTQSGGGQGGSQGASGAQGSGYTPTTLNTGASGSGPFAMPVAPQAQTPQSQAPQYGGSNLGLGWQGGGSNYNSDMPGGRADGSQNSGGYGSSLNDSNSVPGQVNPAVSMGLTAMFGPALAGILSSAMGGREYNGYGVLGNGGLGVPGLPAGDNPFGVRDGSGLGYTGPMSSGWDGSGATGDWGGYNDQGF